MECGLGREEAGCFVLFFFCDFVLFLNFVVLCWLLLGRGCCLVVFSEQIVK